jgi:two-component system response regulator RegA
MRVTKHLLIIEDQDVLSESLSRRFTRRGFEVSISANRDDIIAHVTSGKIDLCLSDIDLTESLSGLDIFQQVRALGSKVPFIFLSGHDETSATMQSALDLGAVAVFTKPTDFGVLLQRVCSVLNLPSDSASLAALK